MDAIAFTIFIAAIVLYFVSKPRQPFLLFVSGLGLGVFLGLLWSYIIRFVL